LEDSKIDLKVARSGEQVALRAGFTRLGRREQRTLVRRKVFHAAVGPPPAADTRIAAVVRAVGDAIGARRGDACPGIVERKRVEAGVDAQGKAARDVQDA